MTNNITYATRRDRRRAASKNSAGVHAFAAGRTTAAVLAASGLVITTGVAANATEDSDEGRESATVQLNTAELNVERASQNEAVAVTASSDVELSFDRPVVSSEAAPESEPAPEPEPTVEATPVSQVNEQPAQSQPEPAPAPTQEQSQPEPQPTSQDQGATTASQQPTPEPEPEPEPESEPSSGGHSSVVGAAYGYIGISWSQMDCSAMVQNAYAQAGVSVPRDTYGQMTLPQVSSPAPGDIVISNGGAHAAIYIGNGQVISSTSSQGIRVHGLHEGWHNVNSYHRPG